MKKLFVLTAALLLAWTPLSHADETGFASIHAVKKENGRRVCMSSHFHHGSGVGKTRKAAAKSARQAWADFTAFEYGGSWGRYKLAASKTMKCEQTAARWQCATSARPCKRHVTRAKRQMQSASR